MGTNVRFPFEPFTGVPSTAMDRGSGRRQYRNPKKSLTADDIFAFANAWLKWTGPILFTPYVGTGNGRFSVNRKRNLLYGSVLCLLSAFTVADALERVRGVDPLANPYIILGFGRLASQVLFAVLVIPVATVNAKERANLTNRLLEWDAVLPLTRKRFSPLVTVLSLQLVYFLLRSALYAAFVSVYAPVSGVIDYVQIISLCINFAYGESAHVCLMCHLSWLELYLEAMHREIKENITGDGSFDARKAALPEKATRIYTMVRETWRDRGPSAETVRRLRLTYGKLIDLKERINDQYSKQMTLTMTAIFVEMVFVVFLVISAFQLWREVETDPSLVRKFGFVSLLTISQAIKLVFTVSVCNNIKTKGNRTAVFVHESAHAATGPDARSEMIMFSLEVWQRPTGISAGGVFTVDFEWLHSVAGVLAGYAIMLIQFKFPNTANGENPIESLCFFI